MDAIAYCFAVPSADRQMNSPHHSMAIRNSIGLFVAFATLSHTVVGCARGKLMENAQNQLCCVDTIVFSFWPGWWVLYAYLPVDLLRSGRRDLRLHNTQTAPSQAQIVRVHTHTHSNTHMLTEAEAGTVKYGK